MPRSYPPPHSKSITLTVPQRFLSVHDQVSNLFHIPYPETVTADCRRASRQRTFGIWREISETGAAA